MQARLALFIGFSIAVIIGQALIITYFFPPPPAAVQANQEDGGDEAAASGEESDEGAAAAPAEDAGAETSEPTENAEAEASQAPSEDEAQTDEVVVAAAGPVHPSQRVVLGSMDCDSGFAMAVTLNSHGATIERAELNHDRYLNVADRSGYLGYLAFEDAANGGCLINTATPGSPAAVAGLEPGDVIVGWNGEDVGSYAGLAAKLSASKPRDVVELKFLRDGAAKTAEVELRRRPLEALHPELDHETVYTADGARDPLSFRLTLESINGSELATDQEELAGVDMLDVDWEVVAAADDMVEFALELPTQQLRIVKRYTLARADDACDMLAHAYHLRLDVETTNLRDAQATLAYRLHGPTGLPTEGWWYGHKVGPYMFRAAGIRDVWMRRVGSSAQARVLSEILKDPEFAWNIPTPFRWIAVDAQYFTSAVLPITETDDENWIREAKPTFVGERPLDRKYEKLANTSFYITTQTETLAAGDTLAQSYELFVGPKKPALLAQYSPHDDDLGEVIYYGWFWFVAKPMLAILHTFYSLVGNYGIAIVLLTVCVRGAMFPVSIKQLKSTEQMKALQPEMAKLKEKYKDKPEELNKEVFALYRKHKVNPVGGCVPALIQLPIFIGLYRSLMVDIELRQAPLVTDAVRWCSNLAAPDMLWFWQPYIPAFFGDETGWFGPYFNVLPLITVVMFFLQSKLLMPPAMDEQQEMQQKTMLFMVGIMGFLFFKVAAGLCLYIIASTTWGLIEKKFLLKPLAQPTASGAAPSKTSLTSKMAKASPTTSGAAERKARNAERAKRKGRN